MTTPPSPTWTTILTIGGSDSGAGAGVQADLKTASALGAYATTAITAITAQNTSGVTRVKALEPSLVEAQIRAVLDDIGADAVKIGMLGNAALVRAVAATLRELGGRIPIVLDPVMIAKGGAELLDRDGADALVEQLFPLATLVTPNADEASHLIGARVANEAELVVAARRVRALGAANALVKGGHVPGEDVADALGRSDDSVVMFRSKRWSAENVHGTGCTLATAIAVGLGRGLALEVAIGAARDYLRKAVAATNQTLGRGRNRPMKHS
ncbi:MAG: bifunctional hydroxymethylpyrimidine kinase/phosphomethylpyrimidine kinase [Polyangiaceae bacterium]